MEIEEEDENCPLFVKPLKRVCPTCFLFISNANTSSLNIKEELFQTFQQFGKLNSSFGPLFIDRKKVNQSHTFYLSFSLCFSFKFSLFFFNFFI